MYHLNLNKSNVVMTGFHTEYVSNYTECKYVQRILSFNSKEFSQYLRSTHRKCLLIMHIKLLEMQYFAFGVGEVRGNQMQKLNFLKKNKATEIRNIYLYK